MKITAVAVNGDTWSHALSKVCNKFDFLYLNSSLHIVIGQI